MSPEYLRGMHQWWQGLSAGEKAAILNKALSEKGNQEVALDTARKSVSDKSS
jgi:hypothetical protein